MATKGAAGTLRDVRAKFDGDVISLHVFFAGHEIPMSQSGSTWKGRKSYDVAGKVHAELVFKAPAGTDYKFVLSVDGAEKIKCDGTSAAALFSRGCDVEV